MHARPPVRMAGGPSSKFQGRQWPHCGRRQARNWNAMKPYPVFPVNFEPLEVPHVGFSSFAASMLTPHTLGSDACHVLPGGRWLYRFKLAYDVSDEWALLGIHHHHGGEEAFQSRRVPEIQRRFVPGLSWIKDNLPSTQPFLTWCSGAH